MDDEEERMVSGDSNPWSTVTFNKKAIPSALSPYPIGVS